MINDRNDWRVGSGPLSGVSTGDPKDIYSDASLSFLLIHTPPAFQVSLTRYATISGRRAIHYSHISIHFICASPYLALDSS
jgi:hypothetical protein